MSYGGASSDDGALRPTHGGRVLLELERIDTEHAQYAVALAEPHSVLHGRAAIALSSAIGPEHAVTLDVPGEPSEVAARAGEALPRDARERLPRRACRRVAGADPAMARGALSCSGPCARRATSCTLRACRTALVR